MAKTLIYSEPVSKDRLDVTSFGEFYIAASAELLAQILAQDIECDVEILVWADCPDKPSGTTYDQHVNIDHGCKGLTGTTTPGERREPGGYEPKK